MMPLYKVTFRGGGPKAVSNLNHWTLKEASSPHVAVSRAMAEAERDGLKLDKGSWLHLSVSRT